MGLHRISLSAKLAINLVLAMVIIFGVIGTLNLQMHRRHLMAGVFQNADQVSDVIKRSTNYSMLRNVREDIYRIIKDIAKEPGILKIRIYNKAGRVSFSTDHLEADIKVNMHAEACIVCHQGPMPAWDAPIQQRARDYQNAEGRHVLGVISPIRSDPSCVASECHAHSPDQKVLGVLDVIMQLDEVDASQREYETRYIRWVALAILSICLIAIVFIYFMVYKPVSTIVEGTMRIAEGELDYRIPIRSGDEIGRLSASFNAMAGRLEESQGQLITAKAYTDNIISSMSNSLVVIDQHTIIRTVNKTTCLLLEYPKEELIGKPLAMLFPDGYYEDIGLGVLPIKDFNITVETAYQTRSGKKIHVLFSGAMVRDERGDFQGVVCMAQDITWQTEAMHAGHLASLGELAAGVAHEINNPLNSVINFAQIVIDQIERHEPVNKELLGTIIKEGDRVSNIVRSLLSFAREHDRVKEKVSLCEILHETLALTEAQLLKDGIRLEVAMPAQFPRINGNFQQIQQVFINIINNARYALNKKYLHAHPDKIFEIKALETTLEGQPAIEISFLDHGTGIPSPLLEKVMNPFFSTKPAGQGTGLGLAISHGIISDHGGRLVVKSHDGEYTKVIIILPITAATTREEDVPCESIRTTRRSTTPPCV